MVMVLVNVEEEVVLVGVEILNSFFKKVFCRWS